MNTFIPLLASLSALISAVAFDRWIDLMRTRGAESFRIAPRLWGGVAVDALFVIIPHLFLRSDRS